MRRRIVWIGCLLLLAGCMPGSRDFDAGSQGGEGGGGARGTTASSSSGGGSNVCVLGKSTVGNCVLGP